VRVLVVGSTGMLGRAVTSVLRGGGIDVVESSRTSGIVFNAEKDSSSALLELAQLRKDDFIVNCVGLTKAHIEEGNREIVEQAVNLNVLFPIQLSLAADQREVRIIQVATDCVFSGLAGGYRENSAHDALDIYGKTKSLGEVKSHSVMHLRSSLIGPESPDKRTLFFEWVRGLEPEAQIMGFENHMWNGLTSHTFGKVVYGIVKSESFAPGVQHLVPADTMTKLELAKLELEMLGRSDVRVEPFRTENSVDRTLETLNEDFNSMLFEQAGYERVPTISEMMEELPWGDLKERRE
jgi:dTDP-4-dehydrorhamnose reductase